MRAHTLLLRIGTCASLLCGSAYAGVYEFMQESDEAAPIGDIKLLGYYAMAFCAFMAVKTLFGKAAWRDKALKSSAYAAALALFVWAPMVGAALVFIWVTLAIMVLASGK